MRCFIEAALENSGPYSVTALRENDHEPYIARQPWCLLFVLIRQVLRGGSGPQRLVERLNSQGERDDYY